jgi:hypothetical protein
MTLPLQSLHQVNMQWHQDKNTWNQPEYVLGNLKEDQQQGYITNPTTTNDRSTDSETEGGLPSHHNIYKKLMA